MRPHRRNTTSEPIRVLLRHADAGPARRRPVLDEWRGLTTLGHAQAADLPVRLGGLPIERVLSSPSLRCRLTVVPLARRLGLEVEPCRLLAPDADPAARAAFLRDPETDNAVICTHRAALLGAIRQFVAAGIPGVGFPVDPPPAAAWTLLGVPGALVRIRPVAHVPTPSARPLTPVGAAEPCGPRTPR